MASRKVGRKGRGRRKESERKDRQNVHRCGREVGGRELEGCWAQLYQLSFSPNPGAEPPPMPARVPSEAAQFWLGMPFGEKDAKNAQRTLIGLASFSRCCQWPSVFTLGAQSQKCGAIAQNVR